MPEMSVAENLMLGREPVWRGLIQWDRAAGGGARGAGARRARTWTRHARPHARRRTAADGRDRPGPRQAIGDPGARRADGGPHGDGRAAAARPPAGPARPRRLVDLHQPPAGRSLHDRGPHHGPARRAHRRARARPATGRPSASSRRWSAARSADLYPRPRAYAGQARRSRSQTGASRTRPTRGASSWTACPSTAHEGEVLGIAGLMGSGRTALVSSLFGLARGAVSGTLRRAPAARAAEPFRNPAEAIAAGLALVGEDRKRHGLVLERLRPREPDAAHARPLPARGASRRPRRASASRRSRSSRSRSRPRRSRLVARQPLRRHAAEGRARQVAAGATARALPGRADARHRRRRQGRDPPRSSAASRGRGRRDRARLLRPAGAARPLATACSCCSQGRQTAVLPVCRSRRPRPSWRRRPREHGPDGRTPRSRGAP